MTDTWVELPRYSTMIFVRFGARYNELNARFYRNMRTTTGVLSLVFGSGAVIAYASAAGLWSGIPAVIAVVCASWNVVANPADRMIQFQARCREYVDLEKRSVALSDADLRAAELELRAGSLPTSLEILKNTALNDVLRELKHTDEIVPPTFVERFVVLFA